MSAKVILFELNEVPWRVVEDFVDHHPHSHLATLLPGMRQYETHAEDTALSPWITWPTLHRGVSDEHHTISDFGQDLSEVNAAYPPVWEILARRGIPTGVCGSLHTYPLPPNVSDYAFYIPDVFAAGSECFPKTVECFQEFNLDLSRASARNVAPVLPWRKALRLLARAPELGLRAGTLADVGLQVARERHRPWMRVRRRTYQVVLAFDIFMKLLAEHRPAFATFFTNHVASSMHRYWAARYPADYAQFSYPSDWVDTYRHEIMWTMSKFDAMLGRLAAFLQRHADYQLWIATSMGQAATEASAVQTQVYLEDVEAFMRRLGFAGGDWEVRPAMLPRVIIAMRHGTAVAFEHRLGRIRIADRGPLPWKRLDSDVFRIHPGALQNVRDEYCVMGDERVPFAKIGFRNVEIEDSAGQSAYHVPHGVLLIHDPQRSAAPQARTQLSTLDVAPMLLNRLGMPPQPGMRRLHA